MSEPNEPSPREQLEARLVAMILGEASPQEEEELQEQLSHDPELDAFYRTIKRTIGLVQEVSKTPALSDASEHQQYGAERHELTGRFRQPQFGVMGEPLPGWLVRA